MTTEKFALKDTYWKNFSLQDSDIEYLYHTLLETEVPLTSLELLTALIDHRIKDEIAHMKSQQQENKNIYLPKGEFKKGQSLAFPALSWKRGKVTYVREGYNPEVQSFHVIGVHFDDEAEKEFAAGIEDHKLNHPPEIEIDIEAMSIHRILANHEHDLLNKLEDAMKANADFVQIARRWFPRSLLVDINIGHLNIAEAILDMAGGGPLETPEIMKHMDFDKSISPKLAEFSLNYALQEDERFDEVGPAGMILWYLQRLEPEDVRKVPIFLRSHAKGDDRSRLTKAMIDLEYELDDELSPPSPLYQPNGTPKERCSIRLIYPHWMAGTLPLSQRLSSIFPTAVQAPRVRFWFVDGETKEKFPAWVVRKDRYVCGLGEWYHTRGLIPGSIVNLKVGAKPGEIVLQTGNQRSSRDYLRTVLVGSDGGLVFAMLRQVVKAEYDERMGLFVANVEGLKQIWEQNQRHPPALEMVMANMMRNISKLTPQGHIHASELYAAVNLIIRCPPAPIFSLLTSEENFKHVGDLYYHLKES